MLSRSFLVLIAAGSSALAAAQGAAAHGGGATVALDYRLRLDPASTSLPGVRLRLLDGDRALEARVRPDAKLLVRDLLAEPLIRFDADGVWVNAASPSATADGLVSKPQRGWVRVSEGRSFAWHDHRLGPPPTRRPGVVGYFSIPIELDGRPTTIAGEFIRVDRPSVWPWLAAGVAVAAAFAVAARRPESTGALVLAGSVVAGLAAVATTIGFAIRETPTGNVAWFSLVTACVLAALVGGLLVRLRGTARLVLAGAAGGAAAVVGLTSLSVFWHGVVVSALPAAAVRLALVLAIISGAASALLSFRSQFDQPGTTPPTSPKPN